jgi:hypothetical protein
VNVADAPRRLMVVPVGDKFCVMDSGSGLYLQSLSKPGTGAYRYSSFEYADEAAMHNDRPPSRFGPLNP